MLMHLVAKIDVKEETPIDHGKITCFSIYSGTDADFGSKKPRIWVDVLDAGGEDLLIEFSPFFEDPGIKKQEKVKKDGSEGKMFSVAPAEELQRIEREPWICYSALDEYWQPFGELLVRMEAEGILVDRAYLAEMEKVAKAEKEVAASRFRNWASKYCPDASI
ncbi:unnamed protein product [Dovyalis caffra]|uniref:Uncharacterized protein n=1 Tax=Dovyalis caffra TaxID=77055 RepID=A0AAV1RQV8_9ROSI|nr:unnamed protein product [Dovyalis caffra]